MPSARRKVQKLSTSFRCANCSFAYQSPIALASVSHRCFGKDPAGERKFLKSVTHKKVSA